MAILVLCIPWYTGVMVYSRVDLARMKERSELNSRRLDMLAKPDKQEFQ